MRVRTNLILRTLPCGSKLCQSIADMPLSSTTKLIYSRVCLNLIAIVTFSFLTTLQAQEQPSQLANSTLLIVRHAEKPEKGNSLTPEGFARAEKYARYFLPFHVDGADLAINSLYAGQDSAGSVRPRLTLEPLSHASGLPLNTQFPTTDPEGLAHALMTSPHGDHVLIAWRHGKIPALLRALNANPTLLLPDGKWPDAVYDWVIYLHYDSQGHLDSQKLIHEPNPLP
jgi:hypothetical protein